MIYSLAERQRTRKSALYRRSVVQKGEKIRVMNNEETFYQAMRRKWRIFDAAFSNLQPCRHIKGWAPNDAKDRLGRWRINRGFRWRLDSPDWNALAVPNP